MIKAYKNFIHSTFVVPAWIAELILGLVKIIFGLGLLAPSNAYESSHAYDVMRKFLPDEVVAGWLFIAMGFAVWAIALSKINILRRINAYVSMAVWFLVTAGFVIAVPATSMTYVIYFLIATWLSSRLIQK